MTAKQYMFVPDAQTISSILSFEAEINLSFLLPLSIYNEKFFFIFTKLVEFIITTNNDFWFDFVLRMIKEAFDEFVEIKNSKKSTKSVLTQSTKFNRLKKYNIIDFIFSFFLFDDFNDDAKK